MTQQILLVDDDSTVTAALASYLAFEGFLCLTANSGQEALQTLNACSHPPAVVLLDLIMPVIGGNELIRILQQTPAWCSIPVIVITGMDKQQVSSLEHVKHVIHKPVDLDKLVSILRKYCSRVTAA